MSDGLRPADGPADEPAKVQDRRVLLGGALAAAVLLGGGAFLLMGGGAEPEVAVAVQRSVVAPAAVSASPSPTPSPSSGARGAGDPQNPFSARIAEATDAPAADAVAGDAAVPAATGSAPAVEVPVVEVPATGVPATTEVPAAQPLTSSSPAPTDTASAGRHWVVLDSVTGTAPALVGHFVLDGGAVTSAVGDDFGPGGALSLVSLTEDASGQWVALVLPDEGSVQELVRGASLRFG